MFSREVGASLIQALCNWPKSTGSLHTTPNFTEVRGVFLRSNQLPDGRTLPTPTPRPHAFTSHIVHFICGSLNDTQGGAVCRPLRWNKTKQIQQAVVGRS